MARAKRMSCFQDTRTPVQATCIVDWAGLSCEASPRRQRSAVYVQPLAGLGLPADGHNTDCQLEATSATSLHSEWGSEASATPDA